MLPKIPTYTFINFQEFFPPIRLFSPIFLLVFEEISHLYFYLDSSSIRNSRVCSRTCEFIEISSIHKTYLLYISMGNVHILQSSFTLIKVRTFLMPIVTLHEAITIMNSSTIFLMIIGMILVLCVIVIVLYKNIEFVWVQGML